MQGNNINRGTINKITTCPNRNWTHPPSSHSITLLFLLYIIDAASTDKSSVARFSSFPHSICRSSSPGYHSGQTHLLEWLLSEAFARYDRDKLTNRTCTGEREGRQEEVVVRQKERGEKFKGILQTWFVCSFYYITLHIHRDTINDTIPSHAIICKFSSKLTHSASSPHTQNPIVGHIIAPQTSH